MPRTVPQQELDRIKQLSNFKIKLHNGKSRLYTAYEIMKIIHEETGNDRLHFITVRKYVNQYRKK